MTTLRFYDGQAYLDAKNEEPFPVKVMADVQSRGIVGKVTQVSCGTTATLLAPANPRRRAVKITNVTGTQIVYLGFDSGVTSSNGDYLHSVAGSNTTIYASDAVYGIASVSAQTLSVLEETFEERTN